MKGTGNDGKQCIEGREEAPGDRHGGASLPATIAAFLALASPARAATFTVNSSDDAVDASLDGVCDSDAGTGGSQCTLRAAVQEANDTAALDVIGFSVNTVGLDLSGFEDSAATGDLDVINDVTINGGNATITAEGENNDRIFEILSSDAIITNVSLEDGGGDENTEDGGNIRVASGATLNLAKSTLSGGEATRDGGGISSEGTLTVTGSTFTDNTADANEGGAGFGGAINIAGGEATVTNSTISGNRTFGTPGDSGGGVALLGGTLSLVSVTLADNAAPNSFGGGISNDTGSAGSLTVENTIVAGNTQGEGDQCEGGLTSLGNNLEDADDCGFTAAGDIQNQDPNLGALASNGGPTQMRALPASSPAIDEGDTDAATDQRGVARPQNGDNTGAAVDDIGAFERAAANNGGGNPPPDNPPSNRCTIVGTGQGDIIDGTPRRDVICGRGGGDIIKGLGGNDVIRGAGGNDILKGGGGNDAIFGQAGNDILRGEGGRDRLVGGPGRDSVRQ